MLTNNVGPTVIGSTISGNRVAVAGAGTSGIGGLRIRGGGVIRNMKSTPDGKLVIAESGVNQVGLVEIGGAGKNKSQ